MSGAALRLAALALLAATALAQSDDVVLKNSRGMEVRPCAHRILGSGAPPAPGGGGGTDPHNRCPSVAHCHAPATLLIALNWT